VVGYLAQYDPSPAPDRDEDLFETGRVNSLFVVQLLTALERHFRIKINVADLDLQNFSTVNKIIDFVVRKQTAAAARG
jgi:D-alanine--poly(phosphoribitol) ligase subunit 2